LFFSFSNTEINSTAAKKGERQQRIHVTIDGEHNQKKTTLFFQIKKNKTIFFITDP